MCGRRPRPLEIAPHDVPILQQIARSRSLPWYQVQRAQVLLAVAAGEPIRTLAIRTQCNPSTVWRICRRYEDAGLPDLLEPPQRAGRPARISPCNVRRSFNWPAWSQSPRACTSPTGRARIWPAKRSKMGSSRPSAIGRSKRSSIRWTSSRIARGIGGRLASTLTSRSVPRRSSGATPTPSGWPGGASGWSVPMRNPTSKSWNDIPSGIRSPARSRSVSSMTRGTARSTSCSS